LHLSGITKEQFVYLKAKLGMIGIFAVAFLGSLIYFTLDTPEDLPPAEEIQQTENLSD